jgi:hypothetical protein
MGVSKSPAELAAKLEKVSTVISGENRDAVEASAQAYKTAVLATGARDTGGDLRLSRWGRNGLRLNAGYDIDGRGPKVTATVNPRPMGPWKVLEYGANPHIIVAGLTRRQGRALTLFSVMVGFGGDLSMYDLGALSSATSNRNNRRRAQRSRNAKFLAAQGYGDKRKQGTAYVRHPGTRGKQTWSDGFRRGTRPASAVYASKQWSAIGEVFR